MSCFVAHCKNIKRFKPENVTFHKFPKEPTMYQKWLKTIGKPENTPWSTNRFVCSKHFPENVIRRDGKRVVLKPGALPKLNCTPPRVASGHHSKEETITCLVQSGASSSSSQVKMSLDSMNGRKESAAAISIVIMKGQKRALPKSTASETHGSTSTNTDSGTKRKSVVNYTKRIHNYSTPPKQLARKWTTQQTRQVRRNFYTTKRKVQIQQRITTLKTVIDDLKDLQLLSDNALEHLQKTFEHTPHILMARCIRNATSKTTLNEIYPPMLREFAVTLQFYSCKAYEYVRRTFALGLPDQATIRKWCSNVSYEPGFCAPAFYALKCKMYEAEIAGRPLICSLLLGGMDIKKQLEFYGTRIWGYIDYGVEIDNDSLQVASEALVLMVVSHEFHWKIPIAYFLIESLTGKEKANIVRESLIRLHELGISITSVTCDGPSAHFTMFTALGAEFSSDMQNTSIKSYFLHPSDKTIRVYCFLDLCHMLKLLRHTIADLRDFKDPWGKVISWRFISDLQAEETANIADKHRTNRIDFCKEKIKVHLADQTINNSIAVALEFLNKDVRHPQFQGCEATVAFIEKIDRLFDILNSRSLWAKGFKSPLRECNETTWRPFLNEAVDYLLACTDMSGRPIWCTARRTPILGFVISAMSVIGIYDDYVKTSRLPNLLTYKLSQDHLVTFFCCVRSRNRCRDSPTSLQFVQTFKKLLFNSKISGSVGGCKVLDTTTVVTVPGTLHHQEHCTVDVSVCTKYLNDVVPEAINCETPTFVDLNIVTKNVVAYLEGYVLTMLEKTVKCIHCIINCYGTFSSTSGLIKGENEGGLLTPAKGVTKICCDIERVIRLIMSETNNRIPSGKHFYATFILVVAQMFYYRFQELFPDFGDHIADRDPSEENHSYLLIKEIVYAYGKIRFSNLANRYRSQVQDQRSQISQLLHKLILLNH